MKKTTLLVPLLFLCVITGFAQTPLFNQVPPVCSGSNIDPLPTFSINGISGKWSPTFNNTTTTTYTFTPDAGQSASTTTMTITVNPTITPTFNLVAPICLGGTLSPLPTTSNNGITGTWSPALTNTLSNYYSFFPNPNQGCATTTRLGISVNTVDTSFSGLNDSYWVTDMPITLTPATSGGTFSGQGVNGNTFSPSTAGAGSLSISYDLPSYSYSGIPYSPLATIGTNVSLGDDEVSSALPVGFNFSFFGNHYTQFYISSNGFISFDSNVFVGCCSGGLLPSADHINNLIAACWDDLDPTAGGTITYYTTGISPNRKLVVSYNNINHRDTANSVTTQIVLYETTNVIDIYNANVSGSYERTEGLENANGSFGIAVPGRNGSIWSATNDGIRFTPTVNSQCPKMTKEVTVKQLVTPIFDQVTSIHAGDTSNLLPTTSDNGITGTWSPATIIEGDNTNMFTPNAGQHATNITMSFLLLKQQAIDAVDDDFSSTPISEVTGGSTPSVFSNDSVLFNDSVSSNNVDYTYSISPNYYLIELNSDGTISVPESTPEGTYTIDYTITNKNCSSKSDTATATIVVGGSTTTGRKAPVQKEMTDSIPVYPNPSSGVFNFDLRLTKGDYNSVKVYNVLGEAVYEGSVTAKTWNLINLSDVASGIYIAKVSGNSGSASFQLIKQ